VGNVDAAVRPAITGMTSTASGLNYKLEPWGTDAVRVRIAASGNDIGEPITGALNSTTPPPSRGQSEPRSQGTTISNGAITVTIDPATALVTVTREWDHKVLLEMTNIQWGEFLSCCLLLFW
jgi:hypothetical protein